MSGFPCLTEAACSPQLICISGRDPIRCAWWRRKGRPRAVLLGLDGEEKSGAGADRGSEQGTRLLGSALCVDVLHALWTGTLPKDRRRPRGDGNLVHPGSQEPGATDPGVGGVACPTQSAESKRGCRASRGDLEDICGSQDRPQVTDPLSGPRASQSCAVLIILAVEGRGGLSYVIPPSPMSRLRALSRK